MENEKNRVKMTPANQPPRNIREFLQTYRESRMQLYLRVMEQTGVSITTAQNWFKGYAKPSKPEHHTALSEITGIKEDDLFKKFD